MRHCREEVTRDPQGEKKEAPLWWSDEEDGSHLSNQSYYNRSDNPVPSCMAGVVVPYQGKCRKKHLLEKGK